jgi:hypothetical protein
MCKAAVIAAAVLIDCFQGSRQLTSRLAVLAAVGPGETYAVLSSVT